MRYLPLLIISLILVSCHTTPKEGGGVGTDTGREREVIGEAGKQIESDQKGILANNEVVKKKLPNDKEPKNIDKLANSSLSEVKRLNDAIVSLKIKGDEGDKLLGEMTVDRDKWKGKAENRYAWMYGAMILIGVGLIALGGGLFVFTQGGGWKMAVTSGATGLIILVLGITIPQYAKWIALGGATIMIGAMGFGVWIVLRTYKEKDKIAKRDHHVKRQLVKDVQASLEAMPGDKASELMGRMSHERDANYKSHISELKALDGLGKPKLQLIPLKKEAK